MTEFLLGLAAVLICLASLSLPLIHRVAAGATREGQATVNESEELEVTITCPCGRVLGSQIALNGETVIIRVGPCECGTGERD